LRTKERTIGGSFCISGIGIHSGRQAKVCVSPGRAGGGVVFACNGVEIPAVVENVQKTPRCTRIGKDGCQVSTVEHLLAACMGLGIDTLRVEVDGPEMPILDGSGLALAQNLRRAGIVETGAPAKTLVIDRTIHVAEGESFIIGMPSPGFSMAVMVDYNHPVIGVQGFFYSPDTVDFEKELAPARTFGFKEELEALLERNLALGGSLENALIVEQNGYMNPPRFPDEIVRHKSLDLLGDLALAGTCIRGHVFACRPGHLINSRFSRELAGLKK
jgi:UDP-3-O-[3-hydroxymyristoyl] N-acetylglucosamine deacetylase